MSERDRIIFCPKCMTRQNFNFGGTGIGVCMVCNYIARNGIIQPLSALAFDEYQSELRLKERLSKALDDILDKEV